MEYSEIGFAGAPKNSKGTALVVVAFLLAALSCASAVYLYLHLKGLTQEKKNFEAVHIQLLDQVSVLKLDIESAQKEKAELKTQMETAIKSKEAQSRDLAENRTQIVKLQTDLAAAQKEGDAMKKVLEKVGAANAPASDSLSAVALEPPDEKKTASEGSSVKKTKSAAATVMKIKTINRTYHFVVLSSVPGRGLKPGDTLRVERDGKWVADLSVKKNYEQFVSAMIKKESPKNLIRVGDAVL